MTLETINIFYEDFLQFIQKSRVNNLIAGNYKSDIYGIQLMECLKKGGGLKIGDI